LKLRHYNNLFIVLKIYQTMYNVRLVIGDFFEQKVMQLFNLNRTDIHSKGIFPDLTSKDYSFCVEVKSSSYSNGGVIKEKQLYAFDDIINSRRFYAFVYHSIRRDIQKKYPTEKQLRKALDLRSLFLFPFSIAKAHFENSQKRNYLTNDYFVQLKESSAKNIFEKDSLAWQHLELDSKKYERSRPHEKVHILTKKGNLKKQILSSFNPNLL